MTDNQTEFSGRGVYAPDRIVKRSILGVWQEHRGAALLFFLGVLLEMSSVGASYLKAPISDTLFSLAAGCFLVAGSISVVARIGYYTHLIPLSVIFFIASKVLAVTRNIPFLNEVPLLGAGSSLNVPIEGGLFSVGAMFILITSIRVIIEIQVARKNLERRHEALLRKTAELEETDRALRVSENLHNALMDNVPDNIYYKDGSLRFTKINRALADYYGLDDPDAAIGKTESDFLAPHYAAHLYDHERALLESGQAVVDHIELEDTHDGRQRYISTTQAPIHVPGGGIGGIVGIRRDITERRAAAEERQRLVTAIEQADESVVIADVFGRIVYVNPAYERSMGYEAAEVRGLPLAFRSDAADDPAHPMQLAINEGDSWRGRLFVKRKNGERIEEAVALSPVHDNDSEDIINFVALKRDITHEVALERQLMQAQKMDALGKLAGGVAHDFRNVLSIARGNCELAMTHIGGGDPLRPYLLSIVESLDRGNDLVRRILAFSKQETPLRQPLDFAQEIAGAMRLISSSLPENIAINLSFDPKSGQILADRTELNRIVMNLCTNALDAMKEKGGALSVRVKPCVLQNSLMTESGPLEPGRYACLEVEDTGTGIPEEYRNRIFEPFFTSKTEGTGFGLPTVHGIVTNGGGGINVLSEPEKGTTFFLFFPVMDDTLPPSPPVPPPVSGTQHMPAPKQSKLRILVVDDDLDLLTMAVEVIESQGYAAIPCANPREALAMLLEDKTPVDILLTDRVMPEMDGLELAEALSSNGKNIPVVLMSGNSDDFTEAEAREWKIVAWVAKPFSMDTLGSAIGKAVNFQRKGTENGAVSAHTGSGDAGV